MQFGVALPWWVLLMLAAAIAAVAWGAYAESLVPLTRGRRTTLTLLRAATLLLLVACVLRPVRVLPSDSGSDAIVPILIDASRSMRLPDVNGRTRIEIARDVLARQVRPALDRRFQSEVWTFGDTLARVTDGRITADAGRSDLSGALRSLRERYRERKVAGILVISDGGDTGSEDAALVVDDSGIPVYTVGIGSQRIAPDQEVLDVAAGEAPLTDSSVDLTVSAISRAANTPLELRVLENGRPIDIRRLPSVLSDSPVREVFTVSPSRETATLYTVEIPLVPREIVTENNRRSVLVGPPRRKRRVLVVEGAPGFEHTFIKRALAADPGIEVDSVVRKGRNEQGDATYFVQALASRAPHLAQGFPAVREHLFQYDALVFANIEPDSLTRGQLDMAADFVGERGGGLLVLGAKSFAQQGLVGTPLEEVLPVDLHDRGGGVVRTAARRGVQYRVALTAEGQSHPVMRVAPTADETAKRWSAVPAMAGATALGAPRPGAQVLAVTQSPDGTRPVLAIQRYGRGRSMVFAGEASWRWRMQLPSTDRTHELFWRQVARWLSSGAPDPVDVAPIEHVVPGTTRTISLEARTAAFEPVADAQVAVRLTVPGGEVRDVKPTLTDPRTGRYSADVRFDQPGVYRITAEARRGETILGTSDRWALIGAADLEMADPRLNEDVLRRVSRASGGRYLAANELSRLPSLLVREDLETAPPRLQELWHNIWIFTAVVLLLAVEWFLRRQWGLR
jgi:uncharacterized membrane protein